MSARLEKEYRLYLTNLTQFVSEHRHQYVLIRRQRVVGFYDSYEGALKAGLNSFGNVAFFIKEVEETENVHFLTQE